MLHIIIYYQIYGSSIGSNHMIRRVLFGALPFLLLCMLLLTAGCIQTETPADNLLETEYAAQIAATHDIAEKMTVYRLAHMDVLTAQTARLAADPDNLTLANTVLSEIYAVHAPIIAATYINMSGQIAAIAPQYHARECLGKTVDTDYFPRTSDPAVYTSFTSGDGFYAGVLLPLRSCGGEICGYVTLTGDLAFYLNALKQNVTTSEEWRYWMISGGGDILYTPLSQMFGKNIEVLNTPDRAGLYRVITEQAFKAPSGIAVYTAYSYRDLKPCDYVVTWDTMPVTKGGTETTLLLVINKLDNRQNLIASVPSTEQTLVEFVEAAYKFAKDNGRDAAVARFNQLKGPFTTKEYSIAAFDKNGTVLADALNPEMVGHPLSYVDGNGVAAGGLLYKRALQGGGYVTYFYPDPSDRMNEHLMINYVLPVSEDWYITAGEYTNFTSSVEPETKNRLITYLRAMQTFTQSVSKEEALAVLNDPNSGYVTDDLWFFAMDYNGTVLAEPVNSEYVGENYLGMTDMYGSSITRDAIILAKEGGGLQYEFGPDPVSAYGMPQLRLEYVLPAGDGWLIFASVPAA